MEELIGRNVDIVDYYTKPFIQKNKGRFKIQLTYPFKINNIFKDKKTIKVDLKYKGLRKYPDLKCKPIEYINFELNNEEKKMIIEYIENNKIEELFRKFWYLRIDTIEDFLKKEYRLNKNNFTIIENIAKRKNHKISFLLELYNIKKGSIEKNLE